MPSLARSGGRSSVEEPAQRREAGLGRRIVWSRPAKRCSRPGASLPGDQRRRQLLRRRLKLLDQRVRVVREGLQAVRVARTREEGREDPEGVRKVRVALRGGREDAFELRIRELSSPGRSESALKTSPPFRTSCLTARCCVSRTRRRRLVCSGERVELADRGGEVGAAALEGGRRLLHPDLEVRAGLGVEGAEDLVELDRVGHLGRGNVAALGELRARAVARGQLDVGLAEQRLLAEDRLGVRRDRRVLGVDRDRRVGEAVVGELDGVDLADGDTGDPHVGLAASWVASLNGTVNRSSSAAAGIGPPKETQRKRASPKQESAKATAIRIRVAVGGACSIASRSSADDRGATRAGFR